MIEKIHTDYRFEGYTLDTRGGKLVSPAGAPLVLSSRAFAVLLVLVERRGQTLSKQDLMDAVWPGLVVEENNLNQAIYQLRKALGDSKSASRFIQTIPGRGYRFTAAVTASTESMKDAFPPSPAWESSPRSFGPRLPSFQAMLAGRKLAGLIALALAVLAGFLAFADRPSGNAGEDAGIPTAFGEGPSPPHSTPAGETGLSVIANSIAVLPFTLLNSPSGGDLFAFGLHEEIIKHLSQIRNLNVISRNSVTTLTHEPMTMAEIGRRLRVEAVITGTILFQEDKARVSLEMFEPDTDVILWAATYETLTDNLAELVSLHRDIALNASKALRVEVSPEERRALESMPTNSFAAYRYHLAANAAYYALDHDSAWQLSKQAITLDPYYYDALYIFASVNSVLIGAPLPDMDSRQHYVMAMEAAQSMIAVAPERTEGHALKASVHSTNREWLGVAEEIGKLEELGASLSDMRFLASVLLCLGDFDRAIAILEANLVVEPVNLYARGFLMMAHELAGNRLQARQEYELGEMLTPLWWGDSVQIFLSLGRKEPLQDIGEQKGISDELRALLLAVNEDNIAEVETGLRHYRDSGRKVAVESLYHGAIAAYYGRHELALELMAHALEESWLTMHWFWLPVFDETRELEAFQDLLVESGMPAYWDEFGWPDLCEREDDVIVCGWRAYP